MKALILCAGMGTRLGDLTRDTPKPMLPIAGRPLLAYNIAYLAAFGYRDIAINLHYKADQIRAYVGDGSAFKIHVHYSFEPELLGTAGAVKSLEGFFADTDDFLVLYGDLLIDQDLNILLETHRAHQALVTLLLHQRLRSNSLVRLADDGRITGFVERPTEEERSASPFQWVNSGVQLLSRRLLQHIPDKYPCDLPRDVYVGLASTGLLYGVPLTGYRCAIDSVERYQQAQTALAEHRCKHWLPTVGLS